MKKKSKVQTKSKDGGGKLVADGIAAMRRSVETNKKIFIERHEYRDATERDFKGRDRAWYDATTQELAGLGYRHVGDVVNVTVAKAAGMVVVLRRFLSADGTSAAAIYHFVHKLKGRGIDLRVCDVESELSDGSFLTSSNAAAARAASMPPLIRDTKYPADTPVRKLVSLHDAAKNELLKKLPKLRFVEMKTAEDVMEAQHRQEAIKAAFRKGIGYLDPAEIRCMAGQKSPGDPVLPAIAGAAADIARKQAQLEEEGKRPSGLLSLMLASDEGKSPAELAKQAAETMLPEGADVPEAKREEIATTMTDLFASADSGDRGEGMKNLFKLMGQLQELEPKEAKETRRNKFLESLAKAKVENEKREAAHAKERVSRGLSAKAGTGKAEPKILIHAAPRAELDYEDKPRGLGKMIQEIEASKDRRDAKTLAGLPLGHSRLGGVPDLPQGQPWPTHQGKKIPFVAQLNLGEFPKALHPLLPARGHLYAFGLISNDKAHWPPPASVFLYEGESSSLVRAAMPSDKEVWKDWGGEFVYEILPATAEPKGRGAKKGSKESEETLGWLQGSMAEVFGTPGEIADYQFGDGDDWINLLAVYSVGSMQWSDAGHLYFLIRRSALEKRDFSKVLAAACSS